MPAPDAILAAPLTANSLHKWAAGISDTLALGLLTEALGLQPRIPVVALPHWNAAQDRHPATAGSIATLRRAGVAVLHGEAGFIPHEPRQGDVDAYPWHTALAELPNTTSRPHG
ncbi:hypothetical protein CLM83_07740 [Streptomyces albidoflavus]|nr:hypothetical protein CLM83_07740 [Streptomyces albidoflavus]